MKSISSVDPFRCCMWELHDRLEGDITEESCRVEIESFLKHGQIVPVLGRRLRGSHAHDIELIFGARRLFVARHLNQPLTVELRDLSDQEAIVAMDIENRQREDISPYERGLSYERWLRANYFDSQGDIARALNVSASKLSRLLKLARLPRIIVNAFHSPADIFEMWGLDLLEIWEDPRTRQAIARQARAIGLVSPRPAAYDVYRQLMATSADSRRKRQKVRDELIKDESGAPLFRIRRQSKSIVVLLPVKQVSAKALERIRRALICILQDANSQSLDAKGECMRKPARVDSLKTCPDLVEVRQ